MIASLTPLTVFSGWPQPEPVSHLHLLLVCVLGPLALGLVIAMIGWTPRLMRRTRDEATAQGLGAPAVGTREDVAVDGLGSAPARAQLGGSSAARRALD